MIPPRFKIISILQPNYPGRFCFQCRLFVWQQDYWKTTGPIFMKLGGSYFGVDPNHRADTHYFPLVLTFRDRPAKVWGLRVPILFIIAIFHCSPTSILRRKSVNRSQYYFIDAILPSDICLYDTSNTFLSVTCCLHLYLYPSMGCLFLWERDAGLLTGYKIRDSLLLQWIHFQDSYAN